MDIGKPMGKLVKIPNILFSMGLEWPKATLWAISWMASMSEWLMMPPKQYPTTGIIAHDKSFTKYREMN